MSASSRHNVSEQAMNMSASSKRHMSASKRQTRQQARDTMSASKRQTCQQSRDAMSASKRHTCQQPTVRQCLAVCPAIFRRNPANGCLSGNSCVAPQEHSMILRPNTVGSVQETSVPDIKAQHCTLRNFAARPIATAALRKSYVENHCRAFPERAPCVPPQKQEDTLRKAFCLKS